MKPQSPSFFSLLQGSAFTPLWHVIGPLTSRAPVSFSHRTRDGEKALNWNFFFFFFSSKTDIALLCHTVKELFLYISSEAPQEFKSLMVVLGAGKKKRHKKFKHYSSLWAVFSSCVMCFVLQCNVLYAASVAAYFSTVCMCVCATVWVCVNAALINETH